ncbi:MAG: S41 family peptidase, partial [Cyclobacteriaceae bacterium]|nr:S41 family peptidase [Cyclobacteriaceae bacterium]
MSPKLARIALVLILVIAVSFAAPTDNYFEVAKSLDVFATLFKEVNALYVDEVDPKQLVNAGITGMLSNLDPYTSYIPEERREAFSIQNTGQYAGIGALIGHVNKKTVVTHPYPGFPASRAGIRVGDEFISVDGKDARGKSTTEVSTLLKGKPQTEVKLVVKRHGQKDNLTFTLKREQIKINNITYAGMLSAGVGYIQLGEFTPGAGKGVAEAVTRLKNQGANRLILDLRDNPGGSLYEAVNIANVFLPKGQRVVSMKGRAEEWNKTYTTLNNPVDAQIPVAVLINQASASASEIVAGALQDYDRALLVGQRSFGKGLVQTTRTVSYGAQVKITTAKYYIPSGRCIQELDYAHRQANGQVEKIADSLRHEFKTVSGRTVLDGGGLKPDVEVEPDRPSAFVKALIQTGLVFDYATRFCNERAAPSDMRNFVFTDADYADFVAWVKAQPFSYQTPLEKHVLSLQEAAQAEQYETILQEPLQQLKQKTQPSAAADLARYKSYVQRALSEQIGFHYYQYAGQRESTLASDKELARAVQLLSDPAA